MQVLVGRDDKWFAKIGMGDAWYGPWHYEASHLQNVSLVIFKMQRLHRPGLAQVAPSRRLAVPFAVNLPGESPWFMVLHILRVVTRSGVWNWIYLDCWIDAQLLLCIAAPSCSLLWLVISPLLLDAHWLRQLVLLLSIAAGVFNGALSTRVLPADP